MVRPTDPFGVDRTRHADSRDVRRGVAGPELERGAGLSQSPRSSCLIAHTRTRRDYYDQKGAFPRTVTLTVYSYQSLVHMAERLTLSFYRIRRAKRTCRGGRPIRGDGKAQAVRDPARRKVFIHKRGLFL